MKVFRISKEKHIKDLTGIGAKLYGGRWNPKGMAILYTSENRSLAALEILIHLDQKTTPEDLKIISLEVPDNLIQKYNEDKFAEIIKRIDANILLNEEGRKWLNSKESLGLIVPSILIPAERNILINPNHKLADEIKILKIDDYKMDERFFM